MRYFSFLCVLILIASCQGTKTNFPDVSPLELVQETSLQRVSASQYALDKEHRKRKRILKYTTRLLDVTKKVADQAIKTCDYVNYKPELCVYTVELDHDPIKINAWADGQKITVTIGMMKFAKSDDQLAYVLSHEIAHNIMSHAQNTTTNTLLGMFVGAMADAAADSAGVDTKGQFQKIGQGAAVALYSQNMEREADYIGTYIAYAAGYNIDNSSDFWRKLSQRKGKNIFFATSHPTNPERYITLEKTAKEIYNKQKSGEEILPYLMGK